MGNSARFNRVQTNIDFPSFEIADEEDKITSGEFFAGGGGWTEGIDDIPEMKTKWILNHDKVAIKTNAFHHPDVKVYWADIYAQDEHDLEYVDHVHASVECQDHSNAKGGEEKRIGSYTMGWELYRYFKFLRPLVLTIENVPEFKKWAPLDANNCRIKERAGEEFERWKKAFMDLGYEYAESIRNAADDGLPTRRVRYFGAFYVPGVEFKFPEFTHSKKGINGTKKWNPCKDHLDLSDEGISIFGREFNEKLPKHLRKKLSPNSLRRIGYGAVKYSPDFKNFIAHFYGGDPRRFQSIEAPINTISCSNRHQLITMEKLQFISDHCRQAFYQSLEEPLKTQLTWQTKQLVSFDHVICQYYGGLQAQSIEGPINTINCKDRHQLIRLEKFQFITKYMNSNGSPELNIQQIDDPLSTVMTMFKHQLITILDNFDIKARFLRPDELAACSTFPRDYFNREGLNVSGKDAVKMIGNAVPPKWAEIIMKHNIENIKKYKMSQNSVERMVLSA
jgi:DNA (cytosine-5)-methyltransferase 1